MMPHTFNATRDINYSEPAKDRVWQRKKKDRIIFEIPHMLSLTFPMSTF